MTAFAFFRFPGVCAAGEVKEGDNRLSEESPGLPTGMGPAHELRTDYRDPDFPQCSPFQMARKTSAAFCPPKPKEFLRATRTFAGLGNPGT